MKTREVVQRKADRHNKAIADAYEKAIIDACKDLPTHNQLDPLQERRLWRKNTQH